LQGLRGLLWGAQVALPLRHQTIGAQVARVGVPRGPASRRGRDPARLHRPGASALRGGRRQISGEARGPADRVLPRAGAPAPGAGQPHHDRRRRPHRRVQLGDDGRPRSSLSLLRHGLRGGPRRGPVLQPHVPPARRRPAPRPGAGPGRTDRRCLQGAPRLPVDAALLLREALRSRRGHGAPARIRPALPGPSARPGLFGLPVVVQSAGDEGQDLRRHRDERVLTEDGLATTFAVNHIGYFLLARLLEPKLCAGAPARVVNVASRAHRAGTIRFDDLMGARGYDGWTAYAQSKLANIVFTYELARRLAGTGVTANCLHPGVVASNFGNAGPALIRLAVRIGRPFMRSSARGAETSI